MVLIIINFDYATLEQDHNPECYVVLDAKPA